MRVAGPAWPERGGSARIFRSAPVGLPAVADIIKPVGTNLTHLLTRIYGKVTLLTEDSPLAQDEKLRLQHYTVFLALGAPMMLVFALVSLLRGETVLGGAVATCVAGMIVSWIRIRRGLHPVAVYRLNTGLFALLLIYLAALGGDDGSKLLWTYTFPLIAFFLFGRREGGAWVVGIFVILVTVVTGRIPSDLLHGYSSEFQVRYICSYALVAVFAYWFEYFRDQYKQQMEAKQASLEEALAQVRALSGLLPICASCKMIRDDQGYWSQIEAYIHSHSEARFTHGICPDCMNELYPDEAREIEEEKTRG